MILFSAATVAALYRIGRGAELFPYSHDAHVLLYLSCIVHYRHDSNSILKSLSRDAYSVGKTLFVDEMGFWANQSPAAMSAKAWPSPRTLSSDNGTR